jgi:hypothetical protein
VQCFEEKTLVQIQTAVGGGGGQAKAASLLTLERAQLETCGGKAFACSALSRLATSWRAPAGVCFPFGNMEAAIQVLYIPRFFS